MTTGADGNYQLTISPIFPDFPNLSITNGIVSTKIKDKHDDFNFEIENYPFLDGDVPRSPSYGVYISQLIRFARVCSHVDDFNNRNKLHLDVLHLDGNNHC